MDNIKIKYPHFHLSDWPFRVVPDESFYSFMADRTQLVGDINTLLRNLSRQPASSIHLMWAWFGAGKTHTLRHIEYLCKTKVSNIIPIYIEFPKSTKNFLDIYRAFINGIDIETLKNAYLEIFTSPEKDKIQKKLHFDFPDLSNALMLLYQGNLEQQEIAIRWLRTEYREKKILRNINVVKPIQSAEDAIKVISWLIRLLSSGEVISGEVKRILWMIDEYQRIEKLRKSVIEEINGCLHSIFNQCPNGLSIIISFSGYPEEKRYPTWLSPEIKDRIGIEKPLLLPPLSKKEAFKFIEDILLHFRAYPSHINIHDRYFPFTKESIEKVIDIIIDKAKKSKRKDEEPKPRTIMQFFNLILQEADPLIEKGKMEAISSDFVSKILTNINLPEE
ncbi:hypothetical protein HS1_000214 [Candidatus Desulfofervidus auxilii]|uniref:ATP-binding protein n=1 Tax=Desulfofervidus auxilii TaxID=1621989 RepID=A0A7U4QIK1_DESA2|nr:hypothetical protein [Candidatus Desulfofervidus auxilii]AMM40020.1 hypothetical protein HS1_000214 [Candidatus Desulfofervidus auxilii]CAD7769870.1 hypothetical protein BLFGPEAP_00243 [Candidatus Methanoperedenaceae archaeon GB50]CAD7770884.1 hypothetical protein DMNBHIDG_00276 [Candidatus Methanoperedenaceae archaeon GB37]